MNHTVCNFLRFFFSFFTKPNAVEICRGFCMHQYFLFIQYFYCWVVFNCMIFYCYRTGLTIQLFKDIWVASSFRLVWIKSLWTIVYRLLWEHKFLLLWDKCHRVWLLTYFEHVYLVLKENTELFSRVTVPFFIPTSSVWKIFPPCLNSV